MSLNGLDHHTVTEAFMLSAAEPGGWFLLKYCARDEVDLLGTGTGGVAEMRSAVAAYEELSPLYGFLRYRRRNVLVKYLPEGCSRLVQVRVAVHFNAVCERFAPYDSMFHMDSADDLRDSTLSTKCSLHAASGSNSSSSSLRRKHLMEIAEEDEDENQQPIKRQSLIDDSPKADNKGTSGVADADVEANAQENKENQRPVTPAVTLNAELAASPEESKFASSSEPPQFVGADDVDSARRMSSQSGRDLFTSHSGYSYTTKPKVKLGPRPSLDTNPRPQTAGNFRPVASIPVGFKLFGKGKKSASSPKKTASDKDPTSPGKISFGSPLKEDFAPLSIHNDEDRPGTSSGFSTKSGAGSTMTKSSGITPEKARLKKAMQLRKKKAAAQATEGIPPVPNLPLSSPVSPASPLSPTTPNTPDVETVMSADSETWTPRQSRDDGVSEVTQSDSRPVSPVVASSEVEAESSTKASSISDQTAHEESDKVSIEAVQAVACTEAVEEDRVDEQNAGEHQVEEEISKDGEVKIAEVSASGDVHDDDDKDAAFTVLNTQMSSLSEAPSPSPPGSDQPQTPLSEDDKANGASESTVPEVTALDLPEVAEPIQKEQEQEQPVMGIAIDTVPTSVLTLTESVSVPMQIPPPNANAPIPVDTHVSPKSAPEGPSDTRTDTGIVGMDPPAASLPPFSSDTNTTSTPPTTTTTTAPETISTPTEPLVTAPAESLSLPSSSSAIPSVETSVAAPLPEEDESLPLPKRKAPPVHPILTDIAKNSTTTSVSRPQSPTDSLLDELTFATVHEAQPMTLAKTPITTTFPLSPQQKPHMIRTVSNPVRSNLIPPSTESSARTVSGGGAAYLHQVTQQHGSSTLAVTKKSGMGSSISQRIKALEMLSAETASNSSAPGSRPSSTFFAVKRTPSRSPSVVDRTNSFNRDVTSVAAAASIASRPTTATSRNGSPETTAPAFHPGPFTRNRSGSISSRLSVFETNASPNQQSRGRPDTATASTAAKIPLRDESTSSPDHADSKSIRRGSIAAMKDFIKDRRRSGDSTALSKTNSPPSTGNSSNPSFGVGGSRLSISSIRSSSNKAESIKSDASSTDKKLSRSARMLHRLSATLGRASKSSSSPPSPSSAAAAAAKTESLPSPQPQTTPQPQQPKPTLSSTPIVLGDLNVQFPDTLLWKRRHLTLENAQTLVFASGTDGAKRRWDLQGLRCPPYVPDVEVQELANSVVLDMVDGGSVQVACESRVGQMGILKVLIDAHAALQ